MAENGSEFDVVAEQIEQQNGAANNEQDDLPEDYKGKSIKEIVQIAESRKSIIGKQGNELGEVRRLADELIKSQLNKPKEQETVSKEVDLFEDPQEFVRRAVETNPKVQAAEQFALQARQEIAKQKLLQAHPDALTLTQEKEFSDWVNGSGVRKELLSRAHYNYDLDAANELISTFKELKAARANAVSDAEKAARKQAINSADVDSGGSGEKPKKVFRRADLLNKMAFDKKWYDENKAEIAQAYAEGRVR